jgi:uncharacterized MAPEG superfamily protein
MKTELFYLLLTAILTAVLWIPVVIGYVASRGILTPATYRVAPTSSLPDWVNRANRAHLNAVENLAPFAAVVLIAHATGVSSPSPWPGARSWCTRSCCCKARCESPTPIEGIV